MVSVYTCTKSLHVVKKITAMHRMTIDGSGSACIAMILAVYGESKLVLQCHMAHQDSDIGLSSII